MSNFNIFISYRRKGGHETAKLIYDRLRMDGYSVSFDIDTLENGFFDFELEKRVKKCKDFLIVLSPGVFDCFSEIDYDAKNDWVRKEIAFAIKANKNIIPLRMEDFEYPKKLPLDIKDITRKNDIDFNPKHFEGAYERLKQNFLHSKPYWKVRHKRHIRYFILAICLAIAGYIAFEVTKVYMKTKEAEISAGSAIIAKESELKRLRDSIHFTRDVEIARLRDSINFAKEAEITAIRDSLEMYKELVKNKKTTAASAPAPAAPKAAPAKTTPKKTTAQTKSSTKKSSAKGGK